MDIYTFRTSAGKYKLKLNATSNEVVVSVNGGWNSFDIPISDFAGASSQLMFKDVTQLCLIASNGYVQNIYIDNMRVCIKDDCAAWRNGKCYYKGR